jgi:transcription-repair coupling factor (superfamily II helicase)
MKQPMKSPAAMLAPGRVLTIANVAEGAEGLVISDLARAIAAQPKRPAVSLAVVCRDGARMQQLARALEFFAPDIAVMQIPAWDCQPYDRVSPHSGILAQRLTALAKLSRLTGSDKPLIVLTTVNAVVQRVPARDLVAAQALSVAPGQCRADGFGRGLAGAQRLHPFVHGARARRIRRARRHPRPVSCRPRPAGALRLLRR